MPGRHLRGAPGGARRVALVTVVSLALGAVLGFGGVLLLEDEQQDVGTRTSDDVGSGDDGTATLEPDPGPVTIAFVGDVGADGPLEDRLAETPDDFVGPFAPVLQEADLTVASLDAVIAGPDDPTVDTGAVAPTLLDALASAGVDVVSVANDRSVEEGTDSLYRVLAAKEARGDGMMIGLGADEDEAYAPFVREVGGLIVAVVAATQLLDAGQIADVTAGPDTPGVASAKRVDRLVAEVEAARAEADVVVVVVHWGVDGETCPSAGQEELAAALVAAGADVVTGAGAGWAQGTGRLGDALVSYGLGTFVGEGGEEDTGVLVVEVDDRGVRDYDWRPGRKIAGVPEPRSGTEAADAITNWEFRRTCTDLTP